MLRRTPLARLLASVCVCVKSMCRPPQKHKLSFESLSRFMVLHSACWWIHACVDPRPSHVHIWAFLYLCSGSPHPGKDSRINCVYIPICSYERNELASPASLLCCVTGSYGSWVLAHSLRWAAPLVWLFSLLAVIYATHDAPCYTCCRASRFWLSSCA